jgi:peptide/nickel transport system substrate-binding protein
MSSDGLTYTFHLREGIKFHDGTVMDAAAVKFSFERRAKVNAGPAYMGADIVSMETPDPQTFVVRLKQVNNAFIHYIATSYGFKVVSPTAVQANEVNGDSAQEWMKTHSAGTGPYTIANWSPTEYNLTAFPEYWGGVPGTETGPHFKDVRIRVIPEFTTQTLELEQGGLDLMVHGVPFVDLPRFEDQGFKVWDEPGINPVYLFVNPNGNIFSDIAVREALAKAIDRATVVSTVYGDHGSLAKTIFPEGMLPDGMAVYDPAYDPAALKAIVDSDPNIAATPIDFAYITDDFPTQQAAGLIQAQLAAAGLNVTVRGVGQPETFEYPAKPDTRPDLLILPTGSDTAHTDGFARLFMYNDAPLSYFSPKPQAEADATLDEALVAPDPSVSEELYAKAGDFYTGTWLYVPIATRGETIVARGDLVGIEHPYASPFSIRIASLCDTSVHQCSN